MTSSNNNTESLIVKYLCGEASHQEVAHIEYMLKSDSAFNQLFKETRLVWEQSANPTYNPEHDWQKIRQRIGFQTKKQSPINFFFKVAAVITLVLSVSTGLWFYWNVPGYGRWVVFETGAASDSVVLPDASIVFLNRNSSLKFRNAFAGDQRKVALQGEGFFEVEHHPEKPFQVEAGPIAVRVTGTAFHIKETADRKSIELNVTQGAVTLLNSSEKRSVNEGEWAIAGETSISKGKIDNNNFISWKTGLIEFNSASLEEVGKILNQHFHEIDEVQIQNSSNILVTTKFQEQHLNQVMEELAIHFEKKFQLDNGILIISD